MFYFLNGDIDCELVYKMFLQSKVQSSIFDEQLEN